jgi:hypothetical protein
MPPVTPLFASEHASAFLSKLEHISLFEIQPLLAPSLSL